MVEIERLNAALEGRYHIVRELGRGGMATVYLVEDLRHGRRVALKVLRQELSASIAAERFLREINIAAQLQHPNILTLIDSGQADGQLFFAMPYVEGQSLRERLKTGGALPIGDAVRILQAVVDALSHAHSRGVVHRDIKPDNVLLSGRHPQVADFGVAKALSDAADPHGGTTAGLALGTPAYMAPEQAAADPTIDHRADIYSVGVLGYELLTGRPPFQAATPQQVLSAQVSLDPDPVTKYRSEIPSDLAQTIMQCLKKDPAERCQTAGELLRQLEASATPSGGAIPVRRGARRVHWPLVAAVSLIAVVAFATRGRWQPQASAVAIDPNAVAVIPFRTAGADPQLAYLREGIVDLFNARLTGSGGLRSVAPQTVISAWRRSGGSEDRDISQDHAMALSRRLGAGQVVMGSVVGSGNTVELSASLFSVRGGAVLADARVAGSQDSITAMVDELAALLLVQQGGEAEQRLAALTSQSLPALRAYLDGRSDYRHGRYLSALVHYRRALELDSTFALAALEAVFANDWAFLPDGWNPRAIAIGLRDRLSERDQALLDAALGGYPNTTFDLRIDRWNRATALAPDRPEVWYGLGDVWYHWGDMIGIEDSRERAASRFQRALALDSTFAGAIEHLLEMAATDGDTAEVRRLNALYFAADSAGDHAGLIQWRTALALGDEAALEDIRSRWSILDFGDLTRILGVGIIEGVGVQDIEAVATELRHRDGTASQRLGHLSFAARGVATLGHLATADSIWYGEFLPVEAGLGARDERPYIFDLYRDFIGIGDSAKAAVAAVAIRATSLADVNGSWYTWIGDRCLVGLWYARRSQPAKAAEMLELVVERSSVTAVSFSQEVPVSLELCTSVLSALVASEAGGAALTTAIAELDSVIRTGLAQTRNLEAEAILVLAQLQANQGRTAEALATVRRRAYWWSGDLQLLPNYLRTEGTLAAEVGDTAGAIRAYQHYLTLRSDPDPRLQAEADEVRAELARLLGEGGRQ